MLAVVTLLWDANERSRSFSRAYSEVWVDRLYRGFARNLTVPFEFICFVDRVRDFSEPVAQQTFHDDQLPHYGFALEPFRLGRPMILVGLDTIVCGNCDDFARYCLDADTVALPRDPYAPARACTGVNLVPAGKQAVWDSFDGGIDDMGHMRKQPHVFIDDLFPGQALSWKVDIRDRGLAAPPAGARIVYFHGVPKPHELVDNPWVAEHWR